MKQLKTCFAVWYFVVNSFSNDAFCVISTVQQACRMRLIGWCGLVMMVLCWRTAAAQDPYAVRFTEFDGLPSNAVYQTFQDKKGFIWFATDRGLTRYDGYQFKTYTTDQTSRAGTDICQDKLGRIWYMNFDGFLYYVENDQLKAFAQNEPIGYHRYGIKDNWLFVVQKYGIDVFDIRTKKRARFYPVESAGIGSTVLTGKGFMVLGKESFLIDFDLKKQKISPFQSAGIEKVPSVFLQFGNQTLLVNKTLGSTNVFQIRNNQLTSLFAVSTEDYVHSASVTSEAYWLCTPHGVYGYYHNGKPWNNGLPFFKSQSISHVLEDYEGNLWVSTTSEGVLFVPNARMIFEQTGYSPLQFYVNNNKLCLLDVEGENYELGSEHRFSGKHSLSNIVGPVDRLFYLNKGLLGTSTRSFQLWDMHGKNLLEMSAAVKDIKQIDQKYFLIAASGYFGVLAINDQKSKWDQLFGTFPELPTEPGMRPFMNGLRAKSVCIGPDGESFYFATNEGLYLFKKGRINQVLFSAKKLYLIQLARIGNTIVGLDESGRMVDISGTTARESRFMKHLPEGFLPTKIRVFNEHCFLIGEKDICFVPSDLKHVERFNVNYTSSEISDVIEWKGTVFVATKNGILHFSVKDFRIPHKHPLFSLLNVRVNNENQKWDNGLVLTTDMNTIEVDYAVLGFNSHFKQPLYYRLNGGEWKKALTNSRTLSFASLGSGDYLLEFKLGDEIQKETISFTIEEPLMEQNWVMITLLFLLVAGMAWYFRYRLVKVRQEVALSVKKEVLEEVREN